MSDARRFRSLGKLEISTRRHAPDLTGKAYKAVSIRSLGLLPTYYHKSCSTALVKQQNVGWTSSENAIELHKSCMLRDVGGKFSMA